MAVKYERKTTRFLRFVRNRAAQKSSGSVYSVVHTTHLSSSDFGIKLGQILRRCSFVSSAKSVGRMLSPDFEISDIIHVLSSLTPEMLDTEKLGLFGVVPQRAGFKLLRYGMLAASTGRLQKAGSCESFDVLDPVQGILNLSNWT